VLTHLLFFGICFFIVLKSADYAIRYASRLAKLLELSDFIISFFIVAVISALPEMVISILSNIEGKQDVAIMALLGSNVVDLTLVFGIVALFARGIHVESHLMKKDALYLVLLVLPLLLGIDGMITRAEGLVLIMSGLLFFYTLSIEKSIFSHKVQRDKYGALARTAGLLAMSLLVMVVSADFTIGFLSLVALDIGAPEILVALLVLATGTCLPELIFTIQSVRAKHDGLALGNILGVVIIDATLVLGILAIIHPIIVAAPYLRVIALFNALGACLLIYFIKTKKLLRRVEGIFLIAFYVAFVVVEFAMYFY
jgi:cation:H+ antiporter